MKSETASPLTITRNVVRTNIRSGKDQIINTVNSLTHNGYACREG